jgi:hypothetical protein
MKIEKGDWVKYRSHEGWTADGKVLEIRPDGLLVIGSHNNDPNPSTVEEDRVHTKITDHE